MMLGPRAWRTPFGRPHLVVLVLAVLLVLAPPAFAAGPPALSAPTPAPGSSIAARQAVSIYATDPDGLEGASSMSVDGVTVAASWTFPEIGGHWEETADGCDVYWVPEYDTTRGTFSWGAPGLKDGDHTVSVTVADSTGASAQQSWGFTLGAPPTVATVTPADGALTRLTSPVISAVVTDNSYVSAVTLAVDGVAVPFTFNRTSGLVKANAKTYSADTSHTVVLTATDDSGRTTTARWTFLIHTAAPTFSSPWPTLLAPAAVWDPAVAVTVRDTVPVIPTSFVIDGTWMTPSVSWDDPLHKSARVSAKPWMLADGRHTAVVYASNAVDVPATYRFDFTVAAPPQLTELVPAQGSMADTDRPLVSVKMTDNGPGAVAGTITVDGVPLPATYNAGSKILSARPVTPLRNGTAHTVVVTATDAAGNASTARADFHVDIYVPMPVEDCLTCHAASIVQHPMYDCAKCHENGPLGSCVGCHQYREHSAELVTNRPCATCHSPQYPEIRQHPADLDSAHTVTNDMSACAECHVETMTKEHVRYKDAQGATLTCSTCHDSDATPVVTAIANRGAGCPSCHDNLSAGHLAAHDTSVGPDVLAGAGGATCGDCHSANMMTEHAKATARSSAAKCDACHPNPRSTIVTFDEHTCSQAGCHVAGGPAAIHGAAATLHAVPAPAPACFGSDCHDTASDLPAIHSAASTTTAEGVRTGCLACHSSAQQPLSAECGSCHAGDQADFHAGTGSIHTAVAPASLACTGCHRAADVRTIHAKRAEGRCDVCHDNPVDGDMTESLTSVECAGCHTAEGTDFHAAKDAKHTATTSTTCFGAGCHDASRKLPEVHAVYVGEGSLTGYATTCAMCHENTDPNRIDWSRLPTAGACTSVCHTENQNPHYNMNARHTVTAASSACTACHGSDINGIHKAYDVLANCARCHANPTNWSKTADCGNCHEPHGDLDEAHRAAPASETITISGASFGTHGCAECHRSTDVRTLHGGEESCVTCHPEPAKALGGAWTRGCEQGGCHTTGPAAKHATIDASHTVGVQSCTSAGCHSGAGNAAEIHREQGCATCHAAGKTPTLACASCHNVGDPHGGDDVVRHTATLTSITSVDSHEGVVGIDPIECVTCHGTSNLISLHANDCSVCHSAPRNTFTTWNKTCQQGGCHPAIHQDAGWAHSDDGYCEDCHDSSSWGVDCLGCHPTAGDRTPPTTTHSPAGPLVVGPTTVTLTGWDDFGSDSLKTTWYRLNGGPKTVGTVVMLPTPASGTASHTIEYWSMDFSGNIEATHVAPFTIAADSVPPTTTSDAVASYVGPAVVKFTVTDNGTTPGGFTTYYKVDGGTVATGTTATVPQPPAGSRDATLQYWSVDRSGNREATKTATLTILADTQRPSMATSLTAYYNPYVTLDTRATDPAPSSGIASIRINITGASTYSWPVGGSNNTWWRTSLSVPSQGARNVEYWATDKAGNESSHVTTSVVFDWSAPVTTSNAVGTYNGIATIKLTATDAYSPIFATRYSLDYGPDVVGTTITVAPPATGSAYHRVSYYSVDAATNMESRRWAYFYVNAVPGVYTLEYTASAGGTVSGTTVQAVTPGGSGTTVTAVPNTGYYFTRWSDGSTDNPRQDTNVTASKSVTAMFALNQYTVTYVAGTGGTISGVNPQTISHGINSSFVTAVPNTGYHFVSWSDGVTTASRQETNVTSNKTVTANFEINAYTLTYTAGANGSIAGSSPQSVTHGASGSAVSAVAAEGYRFISWSDGRTDNPRTDTNVTGNKSVTATFSLGAYTLTYSAGSGGSVVGTSPQAVAAGGGGTPITAVPNTGYHFVRWSDGSTANPRADTNVTADKNVTAEFAINTYTLSYAAGANGSISGANAQTVNHGASGSAVTAVASAGYHFVDWSDGSRANPRTDTNVTASKSVTADFMLDVSYTITALAGGGGSISPAGAVSVVGGSDQTFTITPNAGHSVSQVWVDGVAQGALSSYAFRRVAAPHSITASFTADPGTVLTTSFTLNDYAWLDAAYGASGAWGTYRIYANGVLIGTKVADGTPTWDCPRTAVPSGARIDVVADCGFESMAYAYDGNAPRTFSFYLPAGSTRLEAATWSGFRTPQTVEDYWDDYGGDYTGVYLAPTTLTNIVYLGSAIPTYTVSYVASTGGTIVGTTPQYVPSGGSGTAVTALPNAGYRFVNWSDGSTANPRTDINVVTNKSLTAYFTPNTYTLTYTAGAGGTISGTSPQTVNYGSAGTTVTAVPSTGYRFVSWSDGSTSAARRETNVTADKAVTANFAASTYTLTYTPGANGTISGTSPQTVNHGSSGTTVTAVPSTGYRFVNWSDGSTANPRRDTDVTASKSVTANFTIMTYTLTYSAGAGGTVSGMTPQTVNHGSSGTTVTAVPNTGYRFVSWSDGSTSAARRETNVTASKTVTANFAVNTYTLTYTAGQNGTISGTSPQTVDHGASGSAVTAVANTGYYFVDWSDGSTANPRTDTNVTANKSVTANFAANTGNMLTTSFSLYESAWLDASYGSSGAWGNYKIYANGVLVGTKVADGTTTWDCPQTNVPSGARIDIVADCGFTDSSFTFDANVPRTFTLYLPAGSTRLEAAVWSGFSVLQTVDDWYDGYDDDYTGVYLPATTITNVVFMSSSIPTYTLSYAAGAGGSISGANPQTVTHGGSGSAVTAVPNTGYRFVNWSDGSTANPRTDSNVTANKSVTANFAANTYTLSYTAGAGGVVTGSTTQYVSHGSSGATVTASPNVGYRFVSWSDGVTSASRKDTNVTANRSVTASFATNTYTLTYTAGAGGSISGTSPQTVNHGSAGTTVTAVANAGYRFVSWSDGSPANPRRDLNVTANKSVTASFTLDTGQGIVQTTSLTMTDYAWLDAEYGAWGGWGSYSIYANGVLIGTKPANGTSTWDCPQTNVPSGARIDIVVNCGFTNPGYVYDANVPITYTVYLPAGSDRLEAATWTGFPNFEESNGWYDDYGDYTYVVIPPGTIGNITYHVQ